MSKLTLLPSKRRRRRRKRKRKKGKERIGKKLKKKNTVNMTEVIFLKNMLLSHFQKKVFFTAQFIGIHFSKRISNSKFFCFVKMLYKRF